MLMAQPSKSRGYDPRTFCSLAFLFSSMFDLRWSLFGDVNPGMDWPHLHGELIPAIFSYPGTSSHSPCRKGFFGLQKS